MGVCVCGGGGGGRGVLHMTTFLVAVAVLNSYQMKWSVAWRMCKTCYTYNHDMENRQQPYNTFTARRFTSEWIWETMETGPSVTLTI